MFVIYKYSIRYIVFITKYYGIRKVSLTNKIYVYLFNLHFFQFNLHTTIEISGLN